MTATDRAELISLKSHGGYRALLGLMEELCVISEDRCLALDPVMSDKESILAAHSTARAQRMFFNSVISRVDYEIEEWKGELEAKRLGLD